MLSFTAPGPIREIGRCEHHAVTYYVYEGQRPKRPRALIVCAVGPGTCCRSVVSFARGLRQRVRRALRRPDHAARVADLEGLLTMGG